MAGGLLHSTNASPKLEGWWGGCQIESICVLKPSHYICSSPLHFFSSSPTTHWLISKSLIAQLVPKEFQDGGVRWGTNTHFISFVLIFPMYLVKMEPWGCLPPPQSATILYKVFLRVSGPPLPMHAEGRVWVFRVLSLNFVASWWPLKQNTKTVQSQQHVCNWALYTCVHK